ncbi:hypothetical protein CBS101457_004996 [Exobasidium rhododendri]|nr:hypothetical protein CBS101457_004996 [Exobasidium rhododendri]
MTAILRSNAPSKRRLPVGRMLHVVIILLSLVVVFILHLTRKEKARHTRSFDDEIRESWTQYVEDYPVNPKDRYAFHEMGFRTAMYADNLSKRSFQHLEQAERLESSLWGFMTPAIALSPRSARARRQENNHRIAIRIGKRMIKDYLPRGRRKKQGIVTVVERDDLRATVELVTTLRYSLKDNTPMEIFYHGSHDMPTLIDDAFSSMPFVRTINLADLPLFGDVSIDGLKLTNMTVKRSTTLQALALLVSKFDHIVYAAPGTIFFTKPKEMFKERGFIETGTLFFHNMNTGQLADSNRFLNFLRQQFDQAQPSQHLAASPFYNFGLNHQQDPRVLVLDTTRPHVSAALLLNVWLHSPPVRESIWQAHFPEVLIESLWLSFELSGAPYYFEPAYPGGIGVFDGPLDDLPWEPTICPAHALHFIGRTSYASRLGRPMWADGGLKLFPHHAEYLPISAWSARGRWEQTSLGMCLKGADAKPTNHHSLSSLYQRHRIIDEVFEDIFNPIFDLHGIPIS